MAAGKLRLWLLGFFFDLLDLDLELYQSPLVLHLALLLVGIPTPVERRAQVARRFAPTQ
jgi:hypothetical protein